MTVALVRVRITNNSESGASEKPHFFFMAAGYIHFHSSIEGLAGLIGERRAFAVMDSKVRIPELERLFGSGIIRFDAGEKNKTLESIGILAANLLEAGADRESLLVGIGGGITTDVTGFLASVYMRGIPYGTVPTTLLAQVDAAVGGKNGVNLEGFKNILGTFSIPEFTYICPALAATEPDESRMCGIVEMLKTFLIADGKAYEEAVAFLKNGSRDIPEHLLKRAVEIKSEITGRDMLEKGERRLLNLGHTFGHAIEKCSGGRVPHGKAVAEGILIAARIAVNLGIMEEDVRASIERDFREIGISFRSGIFIRRLAEAVSNDKKRCAGGICFTLPAAKGKAVTKLLDIQTIIKASEE